MTGARLEKKRETDRESQRAVRERTRKYISHLESLVETLQTSQQDERLQRMAQQCKELHDENEQLKSILFGINRMIRGIEVPKLVGNDPNMSPPAPTSVAIQQRHGGSTTGDFLVNYPSQEADFRQGCLPCIAERRFIQEHVARDKGSPILSQPSVVQSSRTPPFQTHPQNPEAQLTSQAADAFEELLVYEKDDAQLFAVIGNALRKAQKTQSLALTSINLDRDADIAIRAVAQGWHVVDRCHLLDSAWGLLRYIDKNIFSCCGSVERLAILRLLRLKLQVSPALIVITLADIIKTGRIRLNSTAACTVSSSFHASKVYTFTINRFCLANISVRPIQNFVEHATLIDYIVW
jgi:hypothetical protein